MVQITVLLQNNIKTIMDSFATMQRECKGIYDAYWKTIAHTTVSALSTDNTPATSASRLTKATYILGVTLSEQLNNFFQNSAVTTGDYLGTCTIIRYGNAAAISAIDVPTESIGDRIKQICLNCSEIYIHSQNIIETYFDNEIGDMVAVIDAQRIVYGSEMTASDLSIAITMLQAFNNFMATAAVATADYSSTISKWNRLSQL